MPIRKAEPLSCDHRDTWAAKGDLLHALAASGLSVIAVLAAAQTSLNFSALTTREVNRHNPKL